VNNRLIVLLPGHFRTRGHIVWNSLVLLELGCPPSVRRNLRYDLCWSPAWGGATRRVRTVPPWVPTAEAGVVEAGLRLVGRPLFCREQTRAVVHGHVYDGSKATRSWGLVYTPVEEILRRTIAWNEEHGYVQPGARH